MKLTKKLKRRLERKLSTKRKEIIILASICLSVATIGYASNLPQAEIDIRNQINVRKEVKTAPEAKILPNLSTTTGVIREVTMYNSLEEQTDSTPCIAASGKDICKLDYNVCATNAFKLGTKLYVEGLGECVVEDRMNKRFKERVDWYAKMDLQRALKFGKQNLLVSVIK